MSVKLRTYLCSGVVLVHIIFLKERTAPLMNTLTTQSKVDLWSVSCTFSSCSAAPPSSVSSPPPICSSFFAAVTTLRGFWVGFWEAGFLTGSSFPFPFLPFFPLSFSSLVEPADYRRKAIILLNVWVSRTEWICRDQRQFFRWSTVQHTVTSVRRFYSPRAAASSAPCPLHPGLCTSPWSFLACSVVTIKRKWPQTRNRFKYQISKGSILRPEKKFSTLSIAESHFGSQAFLNIKNEDCWIWSLFLNFKESLESWNIIHIHTHTHVW